jgi:DNA-binding GntR family transcriptional regulator
MEQDDMREKNGTRRMTAAEKVEDHIRRAIYRGALKPRERIIEGDIAKILKCSRGPVREAILRLERDGLIVTVARRGTFIRDISVESIEAIFSMRAKLEALCVRYLREQLTDKTEQTLRDALGKMKAATAKNDDEAFLAADMHFHQTIWRLSNREVLENSLTTIMNPLIFILARAYSGQTPINVRYKSHAQYLETILTDPISRVERSVEQHFKQLASEVLSRLPSPYLATGDATHSTSAGGTATAG